MRTELHQHPTHGGSVALCAEGSLKSRVGKTPHVLFLKLAFLVNNDVLFRHPVVPCCTLYTQCLNWLPKKLFLLFGLLVMNGVGFFLFL